MSDESGDESGDENVNFIGSFEGGRNENGERHGDGEAILPNKDKFEGQYFCGFRQGLGLYQVMKKDKALANYDGEWSQGFRNGSGTCAYPDGSVYTGFWERDLRHGRGTMHLPNGQVYKGLWELGFRQDNCAQFKFAGGCHIGGWKGGVMQGPGMILYEAPSAAICLITSWNDNKVTGPGYIVRERYFLEGNFLPGEEWRTCSHHDIKDFEERLKDSPFESLVNMLLTASEIAKGVVQVNTVALLKDEEIPIWKITSIKEIANLYLRARSWMAKTRERSSVANLAPNNA